MLVLSRQRDETIEVGGGFSVGGIDVTVVDIRGDKVRLAISAPKEMSVHRKEVADAIRADPKKAAYSAEKDAKRMGAAASPVPAAVG